MRKYFKKKIKRLYYRLHSDYTTEDLIALGMKVGKNFVRMHGVILDPSHCWHIHIGDNVTIAPRAHIIAHDASFCHHIGYARVGNVAIGNNVFIGAETVVLPGVTIGDNCIIGANSTVSRDIPSDTVAAGSPATVICSVEEYKQKANALMKRTQVFEESYTLRNPGFNDTQKKELQEACRKNKFIFVK